MPDIPAAFPPIVPTVKRGDEVLHDKTRPIGPTLHDFWRWSASDLLSNATRGVLAEFIVASALGLDSGTRSEWDSVDLCTTEGARIEVKSAAYLQSWAHQRLSTISFDIRPTRGWDFTTGRYSDRVCRQADIYVFCLLNHVDKSTVDPLDVSQWQFFLVRTSVLDALLPAQKRVRLGRLLRLEHHAVAYHELASSVVLLLHER